MRGRRTRNLRCAGIVSLVLALLAPSLLVGAEPARADLPTGGMSAAALNAAFSSYGDTSGQWSGGDSTVSIPLPDGRDAWLFSDTFLGTVNADHSRPANSPFIHNSMVIQDGTNLVSTRHGGTAAAPDSLVKPATGNDQYWALDGTVEGNQLRVFYLRMRQTGTGPFDFEQIDTALVTFALPALTIQSITDLNTGPTVGWGSTVVEDGAYTYIYGAEFANGLHFAHVARAPAGGLSGPWQFWTGTAWSSSSAASGRVLSGVGTGFGVQKIGGQYVLITQETNLLFSPTFVAYTATSPTGPFTGPIQLFTAPEPTPASTVIVYDSRLHPELAAAGKLLISYNVNSLVSTDTYANVDLYRPKFVEIAWPLPVPNPAGLPGAPTSLTVSTDATGAVHLGWSAPAGTGLTYNVYQRDVTAGQTHFAQVAHQVGGTTTDINWFNTTGHTYEYKVTARNAAGEGPASTVVSATVTIAAPAAPTGVTVATIGDGSATVTWAAVPAVWRYEVYRRDVTLGEVEFARDSDPITNDLTYTASNLEPGHQYAFRVVAIHGGGESAPSATVTATAHYDLPGAPTGLAATSQADGSIALSWTNPQAPVWYRVFMRDVTAGEADFTVWPMPVTTCCTTSAVNVVNNHQYEFRITATNKGGESPASTVVSATSHVPLPAAPTNLQATPGNGQAVLTWSAGSNTWFKVYMRDVTAGEPGFTALALPVTSCCSMTAAYLTNGHQYEFKVSATNASGESPASSVVQVTPQLPLPGAPTGLSATAQPDGTISLNWTAPGADLWYVVYQRDVTAGQTTFTQWPLPITSCCVASAAYLTNHHVYEFKVTATNGGTGPASAVASAMSTSVLPSAPANLRGQTAGPGNVELTWDPLSPYVIYWVYYRDVTAGATTFTRSLYPTDGTTATMGWLSDAHTYEWKVTADNQAGEGPASAVLAVTAQGGVPQPPSNLVATAGDGQATLTFTTSSTPGSWYAVYMRDVTAGQSWQRLPLPLTTCCTFTAQYLANGNTYEFKITATNAIGESTSSNVVIVRPLPPLPAAPSGLTAASGNKQALLSWTGSSTPDVWYAMDMRDLTTGENWRRLPLPITSCCSMTGAYLVNGHTYQFKVVATNLAGESTPSNVVSVKPLPPSPQAPAFAYAEEGDGQITLRWTPSVTPGVWYAAEYQTEGSTEWTSLLLPITTCCELTAHLLANGTLYLWRVRATNEAGISDPSNVAHVTPMPPFPEAPAGVAAEPAGPGAVLVYWGPSPTPRVNYWIEFRLGGESIWQRAETPVTGTAFVLTSGFYNGEVYEFQVHAFNFAGVSSPTPWTYTVVPRQNYHASRLFNDHNKGNFLATQHAGTPCEPAMGQTVCFNSHPLSFGEPSTWGDYFLWPGTKSTYDAQVKCEAYKRAELRTMGRDIADEFGPDVQRHESVHSDQWAWTYDPGEFEGAYLAAAYASWVRYQNPWEGNFFELKANLYWGGYRIYGSGRHYAPDPLCDRFYV